MVVSTLEAETEEETAPKVFWGQKKNKNPRLPKDTKLKVRVQVEWVDGSSKELSVLVDTGAEVNLINPKLMNPDLLVPSTHPVRLGVANSLLLKGGGKEVTMTLTFQGKEMDTGKNMKLCLPVTAYDGEMVCDLILSYGWLAQNDVLINPRRHGLLFQDTSSCIWVPGLVPLTATSPKC